MCPSSQRPPDQNLIDVAAVDLRMILRGPDNHESPALICLQGRWIIRAHKGEELLITRVPRLFEGRFEQSPGDALASEAELDERADGADVIERLRVVRKRLRDLKADELPVRLADRNLPDSASRKAGDEVALRFDAEWRVESGIYPRLDDRIENPQQRLGVVWVNVTNG